MPKKLEPIEKLIRRVESVLERAKDDAIALRAAEALGDLYATKMQMMMAVDSQKALRVIPDQELLEEVKRRGISMDSQVIWRVVRDDVPNPALPETSPEETPIAREDVGNAE